MPKLLIAIFAVAVLGVPSAEAQKGEEKMKAVPSSASKGGYDMIKSKPLVADPKQTGKGGYDQQKSIKPPQ